MDVVREIPGFQKNPGILMSWGKINVDVLGRARSALTTLADGLDHTVVFMTEEVYLSYSLEA